MDEAHVSMSVNYKGKEVNDVMAVVSTIKKNKSIWSLSEYFVFWGQGGQRSWLGGPDPLPGLPGPGPYT